jgi:hypothetical protein
VANLLLEDRRANNRRVSTIQDSWRSRQRSRPCQPIPSNIMHRYPKLQRVEGERKANRGVFRETELQAIFATGTPFELSLFGT